MARRLGSGEVAQTVEPCLVPTQSELGSVEGVFNAVLMQGDYVDKIMMEGRGAGEGPTASSVVADIIDLAKGTVLPAFGVDVGHLSDVNWHSFEDIPACFYLHLKVKDEAGVLADITNFLKDENISVDSFIQHGHEEDGATSIVIITHETDRKTLSKVVSKIETLPTSLDKVTLMRIEG